jgi:N-acyl-D-aspartate/D-glutamate deacylase
MFDLLIRDASIIDGSGEPARHGSIAVNQGRIVAVGEVDGRARRTIQANGYTVTPGFIDVHTHLDVQGFWDPTLSPSPLHGVTTVIGGNCGFSVAPITAESADYLMPMLARVEGMPLESLQRGVPWDWASTAEFFDRLEGKLAVNAGFMVGHSAVRRVVMGPESTRRSATATELDTMADLLRQGLAAGGLGFSSSWSITHNDADGEPVPSRLADRQEMRSLAKVCGEFSGTSLEFVPSPGQLEDQVEDVMLEMTAVARRPLNWNVITPTADTLEHWRSRLALGDRAIGMGGRILGLALPLTPPVRFSFRSGFVLDALPGWREAMALPPAEKLALLEDPEARRRLHQRAQEAGPLRHIAFWSKKVIVETFTQETKRYEGLTVGEIAEAEGKSPFDALLDIVCADRLSTTFSNPQQLDTPLDWEARREVWKDSRVLIGGSDAGAHLDMIATFNYPTVLLQHGVREHNILTLEEAVHYLTDRPAQIYGLRDRGRLQEGACADFLLFDPDEIGSEQVRTTFDLPGDAARLFAGSTGIGSVFVNGLQIVGDGVFTQERPGSLLRSGRDTIAPSMT